MFGKTFVERRSILTMYRTFYRVWAFLFLEFHFMAVGGRPGVPHARRGLAGCLRTCILSRWAMACVLGAHPNVSLCSALLPMPAHSWCSFTIPSWPCNAHSQPMPTRPLQVMVWGWDATTSGNYYPLCSVPLGHATLSLLEQFAGAWTQRSLCKGNGAGEGLVSSAAFAVSFRSRMWRLASPTPALAGTRACLCC